MIIRTVTFRRYYYITICVFGFRSGFHKKKRSVNEMKYRDVLTTFLVIGFFLSLAYSLGVAQSLWWLILPILFGIALVWALYYLWLT